jgi:hypothetical protein
MSDMNEITRIRLNWLLDHLQNGGSIFLSGMEYKMHAHRLMEREARVVDGISFSQDTCQEWLPATLTFNDLLYFLETTCNTTDMSERKTNG